jgi:tetraprenyl-beta-curcumene synthase
VVRALVAFQAAYNLTDTLAEQPSLDRSESARQLHERLHSAFAPEAACLDPLERQPQIDDDGYLAEILEGCREAVGRLPSYPLVASALQGATERIVTFQSLSSAPAQSAHQAFEGWALEADAPADAMWWWEMAAAAGSSLPVHALIAAAADGRLQAAEVRALERAYFPWVGALHSLLDSVVDQAEDAELQQLSLIGCYPSTEQAAVGMARIATEAARRTRALPGGRRHAVMLAGMTGFYLHAARSSSPAHDRELPGITEGVLTGVGPLVRPVLRVFAARALAGRLVRAGSPSRRRTRSAPAASSDWCSGEGGVDAGAA